MADQPRKDQTKDLPPKKVPKSEEENVKGGAVPMGRKGTILPFEPING